MGILDILGANGGLLNFLQNNGLNQNTNTGIGSDDAGYAQAGAQAPLSMAGPSAPTSLAPPPPAPMAAPTDAPQPASAPPDVPRPAPAPMSFAGPPAQAPSPGLGDRLGASLQSFNNTQSGGLLGKLTNGISSLVSGQRTDAAGVQQQAQQSAVSANATALGAKGIDPAAIAAATASAKAGNLEPMKTLFNKAYGPQTVQSLGSGYIADKEGKITRAFEPDDKTPVGFQKTDKGLQAIPGGPADPSYIRSKTIGETDPNAVKVLGKGGELYKIGPDGQPTIVHKNDEGAPEATLNDPTTSAMAAQYLAGDRTVMQNLGRGAQGAANIVKLRTEIYKQAQGAGLDGKGIVDNFNEQAGAVAGQRAVGTRAANISLAANEANNMIPIALAASDKLPRSQYMPWNQMVQAVQKGASSPELASFVAATNSLVNSYVRAVSPSGVPTDSMRQHAYDMLNAAQGPEAYKAVVATMKQEMGAALSAPSQVRKELRGEGGNSAPGAPVKIDGYTITEH